MTQKTLFVQFAWFVLCLGFVITGFILQEGAWFRAAIIVGAVPLLAEMVRAFIKKRSSFSISVLVIGGLSMWAYQPATGAAAVLLATLAIILLEILKTQSSYVAARLGFSKVPLVRVVRLDHEQTIPYASVKKGDRIIVQPGETLPVDGRLISQNGKVRTNFGARTEIEIARGEPVIAGDRAASVMVIEAVEVGTSTTAVKVAEIFRRILAETPPVIKRFDLIFLIGQIVWSIAVIASTFFIVRRSHVVNFAIADFLWLGPLVARLITLGTIRAAGRAGILFKQWTGITPIRHLTHAVLDKTGTITEGIPELIEVIPTHPLSEVDVTRLAASLEHESDHPIARTLKRAAEKNGVSVPQATDLKSVIGEGVIGNVENELFVLGRHTLLESMGVEVPASQLTHAHDLAMQGATVIYLASKKNVLATFALRDVARKSAKPFVQYLKANALTPQLISGDELPTVNAVGISVGIADDQIFAHLGPDQKEDHIKKLSNQGSLVVAEPASDKKALAAATLGIGFMGHGPAIGEKHTQVVIQYPDLGLVARAVHLLNRLQKSWLWLQAAGVVVSLGWLGYTVLLNSRF